MAIAQVYEIDGVTISTTEISIVSGTSSLQTIADAGIFCLWLDCVNVQKGDEFTVRLYEKVEATGGTKRLAEVWTILGVQSSLFHTPGFLLLYGWDWTIQRTAGGDRAFDGSIRKIG